MLLPAAKKNFKRQKERENETRRSKIRKEVQRKKEETQLNFNKVYFILEINDDEDEGEDA